MVTRRVPPWVTMASITPPFLMYWTVARSMLNLLMLTTRWYREGKWADDQMDKRNPPNREYSQLCLQWSSEVKCCPDDTILMLHSVKNQWRTLPSHQRPSALKGYGHIQVSIVDSCGFQLKINCFARERGCRYSTNIIGNNTEMRRSSHVHKKGMRVCIQLLIDELVTWNKVWLKTFQCQQISRRGFKKVHSSAVRAINIHCLYVSITVPYFEVCLRSTILIVCTASKDIDVLRDHNMTMSERAFLLRWRQHACWFHSNKKWEFTAQSFSKHFLCTQPTTLTCPPFKVFLKEYLKGVLLRLYNRQTGRLLFGRVPWQL